VITVLVLLLVAGRICPADTFTNIKTGEILHGYATTQTVDNLTVVQAAGKDKVNLNLADWIVTADRNGRNNTVIVLSLDRMIMYEIETAVLEEALAAAVDTGPLFILLEIDTPGGRVDLAQRIAAAINKTKHCQVISYVKGGENGGAISAGVAVALACDKNYMATNAVIGGATMITISGDAPMDLKKAYGSDVGEKFSSIWKASLASLAEKNGRPALMARAMVDKEIEVVEVEDGPGRMFIDPVNKKPAQQLVKTWTQKGSLLTLTATEAVQCKIADKTVGSREQLLRLLDAADAEIKIDNRIQQAAKELSRATLKVKKLREKIDLELKQLKSVKRRGRGMSLVRKVRGRLRTMIVLAKQYPDLQLDLEQLQKDYNSVEAFYQQHKRAR